MVLTKEEKEELKAKAVLILWSNGWTHEQIKAVTKVSYHKQLDIFNDKNINH